MKSTCRGLACACFALWIGCATNDWRAEDIPYPRTTPFDSSGFARSAYLDGFGRGYAAEMSGGPVNADAVGGVNAHARRQGYYAGVAHARAEKASSEKARPR